MSIFAVFGFLTCFGAFIALELLLQKLDDRRSRRCR